MPTASSKLQRWTDLLAALLIRRFPASLDEFARDVPAYSGKQKTDSSLMRMFDREKDELRAFGIPIETVTNDQGETGSLRTELDLVARANHTLEAQTESLVNSLNLSLSA